MKTYEFILKLDIEELTKSAHDALFEAGCGDALIFTDGEYVFMDFWRPALSKEEAIKSAIRDVNSAGYSCIEH